MGGKLSIPLFESSTHQVVMLGLDNAGKSTIIYRLKLNQFVQPTPTIGFNCEKFRLTSGSARGQGFSLWDVGGQEKLRPLWRSYIRHTDAVLFVIDSTDVERFEEVRLEIQNLLRLAELPKHVPILLLANKQDLPLAKTKDEIEQSMCSGFESHLTTVLGCCAVTGEGLDDIFSILYSLILDSRRSLKKR
ncbi:hypothetical protein QR680_001663 [Steinernema hermaphroditum]|uniref:Uncharacterized protein n=1 Tax=Steinernema hermaphroditum TaxID=289476 RepID=A0AA39LG00_9BILA|nr:hypothetical protein QR680_001663 [Steinernema hermaphroditum]